MKRPHTIIYVTGLGDKNVVWQKKIVNSWQIFGVKATLFQMNWTDEEPFSSKIDRLFELINKLKRSGHNVSLVGASAGASAALSVFIRHKPAISGIVFICGKLAHPETVSPSYYQQKKTFKDALKYLGSNFAKLEPHDKQKMLSIHPLYDQTVEMSDTMIEGIRRNTSPSL